MAFEVAASLKCLVLYLERGGREGGREGGERGRK